MKDLETPTVVRVRRRAWITPIEAAALAVRWLAVAVIVAVWVLVAMIIGR